MTHQLRFAITCCLLFASLDSATAVEYVNGKVVYVPDGDTIHVKQDDDEVIKIRLHAIDCPEIAQPHGDVARGITQTATTDKVITAIVHDVDSYGRFVCEVFIDGESLNRKLAAGGHAWWYSNYAKSDYDIERLQGKAKAESKGLWASANPIAPWDWRRGIRGPEDEHESAPIVHAPPAGPQSWSGETESAETEGLTLGVVIGADLQGDELRAFLIQNYKPDQTLSYQNARKAMFATVDNYDGEVQCVYSGARFETMGIPDHNQYNTEHTWPQSRFDDTAVGQHGIKMKCDIHHLFPTNSKINNDRANKPFAEIPDHETVRWWVSSMASVHPPEEEIRDEFSESTSSQFEPREAHKGNVARALFYLASIYADRDDNDWDWYNDQVETLKDWHEYDPADEVELERTLRIGNVQGNVNPFVIDATLVERIYTD